MFIHALFYFIGKCFALPYKIKPSAIMHTNSRCEQRRRHLSDRYVIQYFIMPPFVLQKISNVVNIISIQKRNRNVIEMLKTIELEKSAKD